MSDDQPTPEQPEEDAPKPRRHSHPKKKQPVVVTFTISPDTGKCDVDVDGESASSGHYIPVAFAEGKRAAIKEMIARGNTLNF